jgi:hypothetical protein
MEDEHRPASRPTEQAQARAKKAPGTTARKSFYSPFARIVFIGWGLFAAANLIDLAIQGRDRFSLLAAIGLVLVTGVLYAGAWRPRIATSDDGLTISNPVRDHKVGWAAISLIEATELVRVKCEWPLSDAERQRGAGSREKGGGTPGQAGAPTGKRVIYAWAVHSARRKERIRELRKEVRNSRPGGFGLPGGFKRTTGLGQPVGYARYTSPNPPSSVSIDADQVAAELAEMNQQKRDPASEKATAVAPVSSWSWPALAAIIVPALALLIVALL